MSSLETPASRSSISMSQENGVDAEENGRGGGRKLMKFVALCLIVIFVTICGLLCAYLAGAFDKDTCKPDDPVDPGHKPLAPVPPYSLVYGKSPITIPLGSMLPDLLPNVGGSRPMMFTMTPSNGIMIHKDTGKIFGTPYDIMNSAEFKVRAKNEAGETFTDVYITVEEMFPSYNYLDIIQGRRTLKYGDPVSLTPTYTGNTPKPTCQWSVNPPLPEGLTMDASNGVISGTASEQHMSSRFVVQVANRTGAYKQIELFLSVDIAGSPSATDVSYEEDNMQGTCFSPFKENPLIFTGNVIALSITDLPPGMDFNPYDGSISGTPSRAGTYNTIVTLTGGDSVDTNASVTITVAESPPIFSYDTNDLRLERSVQSEPFRPTITYEGEDMKFSLVGSPSWMTIEESTGVISTDYISMDEYGDEEGTFDIKAENPGDIFSVFSMSYNLFENRRFVVKVESYPMNNLSAIIDTLYKYPITAPDEGWAKILEDGLLSRPSSAILTDADTFDEGVNLAKSIAEAVAAESGTNDIGTYLSEITYPLPLFRYDALVAEAGHETSFKPTAEYNPTSYTMTESDVATINPYSGTITVFTSTPGKTSVEITGVNSVGSFVLQQDIEVTEWHR